MRLTSFVGFLLIVAQVCAIDFENLPPDNVIELDGTNLESTVQDKDLCIVFFYAPWCGSCKKFYPEYEKAAEILKDEIPFYRFNSWNESHIPNNQKYNVSGYPTVVILRKGDKDFINYQGERTPEDVVRVMRIHARAPHQVVDADEIREFKKKQSYNQLTVVGFFEKQEGPEFEQFLNVSNTLRDKFQFLIVDNADETQLAELKIESLPTALFLKPFDEQQVFLKKEQFNELNDWVIRNQFPLLGEIGKGTSKLYIESGIPIAFLFVETEEQRESFRPYFTVLAQEYKMRVHFVFIDWKKYGTQSKKLGLSGTKVPTLTIENTLAKTHFAFDENAEITESSVRTFVENYLNGQLKPTIVSEKLPEGEQGPVKTVVALNFKEIVLDNDKDVFLELYAPWCGHCKKLIPTWEQLAKDLENEPIVIAKIDATANDLDSKYGVRSFPTLLYFKANDKENPVEYNEKGRELETLHKFVQQNASYKSKQDSKEKRDEL